MRLIMRNKEKSEVYPIRLMMKNSPLISVVILNWNGKEYLSSCIRSVREQTYPHMEMILVDNVSKDGSVEVVKNLYSDVNVIINRENLGSGTGNNVGVRASQGEYVMMLNNDTRLYPKCMEELKRSIEKDGKYGACASKILLEYEDNVIDAAGIVVCPDGLSIGRGKLEKGDRYDEETEVLAASTKYGLFSTERL